MTLAREKKALWRMVFVRLPMPICWARSMALIMYELDVVLRDVALRVGVEVVLELLKAPLAVDQEHSAGLDASEPS